MHWIRGPSSPARKKAPSDVYWMYREAVRRNLILVPAKVKLVEIWRGRTTVLLRSSMLLMIFCLGADY